MFTYFSYKYINVFMRKYYGRISIEQIQSSVPITIHVVVLELVATALHFIICSPIVFRHSHFEPHGLTKVSIPRRSELVNISPAIGCNSFSFSLFTEHSNVKRCPKGSHVFQAYFPHFHCRVLIHFPLRKDQRSQPEAYSLLRLLTLRNVYSQMLWEKS